MMQNHTLVTSPHQGREYSRAAGVIGHFFGINARNLTIAAISEVAFHVMELNATLMKNQIICCGTMNISFLDFYNSSH